MMKVCSFISQKILNKYSESLGLSKELISGIKGKVPHHGDNTWFINKDPLTGKQSKIFGLLMSVLLDLEETCKATALLYSDEFSEWYGAWYTSPKGPSCEPILNYRFTGITPTGLRKFGIGTSAVEAFANLIEDKQLLSLVTVLNNPNKQNYEKAIGSIATDNTDLIKERAELEVVSLLKSIDTKLTNILIELGVEGQNLDWFTLVPSTKIDLTKIFEVFKIQYELDKSLINQTNTKKLILLTPKIDSSKQLVQINVPFSLDYNSFIETINADLTNLFDENAKLKNSEGKDLKAKDVNEGLNQRNTAIKNGYNLVLQQYPTLEKALQNIKNFQTFINAYFANINSLLLENNKLTANNAKVQETAFKLAAEQLLNPEKLLITGPESILQIESLAETLTNDKNNSIIKLAKSSKEALRLLSSHNKITSDFTKNLIEHLGDKFIDSKIEFNGNVFIGKDNKALFDPKTNTIYLRTDISELDLEENLLHEILHAQTYYALRENPELLEQLTELRNQAINLLCSKYKCTLRHLDINSKKNLEYYLMNDDEFLAGAWSNKDFIVELNSIGKKKQSLLSKFITFVKNIFNLNKYSELFDKTSKIIEDCISYNSKYLFTDYGDFMLVMESKGILQNAELLGNHVGQELIVPNVSFNKELVILPILKAKEQVLANPDKFIYTLRPGKDSRFFIDGNSEHHFGNPFGTAEGCDIKVQSVADAVKAYKAWLHNEEAYIIPAKGSTLFDPESPNNRVFYASEIPQQSLEWTRLNAVSQNSIVKSIQNLFTDRRDFVLNSIKSGSLFGKELVYYTQTIPDSSYGESTYNPTTAPCHAHILQEEILKEFLKQLTEGKINLFSDVLSNINLDIDDSTEKLDIWWGGNKQSILSNLAPRPFIIDGIIYKTVEHYFLVEKARVCLSDFNNGAFTDTFVDGILNSPDGVNAKKLGSGLPNFEKHALEWDLIKETVMYKGIKESLKLNPNIALVLLSTGSRTLTHIYDRGDWKIKFPKILMQIRQELLDNYNRILTIKQENKAEIKNGTFNRLQEISEIYSNAGETQDFKDTIKAAKQGVSFSKIKLFFTEDEALEIGVSEHNIMSVSRRTDPVFFAEEVILIINRQKDINLADDSRINCVDIWTKHDGLPLIKILKACKESRVAPMLQFSITGLGDTDFEKGVMKYLDLIEKIEEIIKLDLIDINLIKVRIDPIIPGVTTPELVEDIISRCEKLGITLFSTSMLQSYTKTSNRLINELRLKANYDWDSYYEKDPITNIYRNLPNSETFKYWRESLAEIIARHNIIFTSCAINGLGLPETPCLDPAMIAAVLGAKVDPNRVSKERTSIDGNQGQCNCYGHGDILRYDDTCLSSCIYCYAHHGRNNPFDYYDTEGNLIDTTFTRTTDELEGFINHSGGAIGSDSFWGDAGLKYGVISNHYYHADKTPNGNIEISEQDFIEGLSKVALANLTLQRKPDNFMNLLARSWVLVKYSDAIFAIIMGFADTELSIVLGGTGWAIQMAIDDLPNKERNIYVFNLKSNSWYLYSISEKRFVSTETPMLTKNYAGIGTKELNTRGKNAIYDVYKKTVRTLYTDTEQPIINFVRGYNPNDFITSILSQRSNYYYYDLDKNNWGNKLPDFIDPYSKLIFDENDAEGISTIREFITLNGIYASDFFYDVITSNATLFRAINKFKLNVNKVEKLHLTYNEGLSVVINDVSKKLRTFTPHTITIRGKAGTGKSTIIGKIASDAGIKNIVSVTISHDAKRNIFTKILQTYEGSCEVLPFALAGLLGLTPKDNFTEINERTAYNNLREVTLLVVDEASMLTKFQCEDIERVVKLINLRRLQNRTAPLHVIYLGDPGQAKPMVGDRELSEGITRYNELPGLNRSTKENTYLLTERVRLGEGSAILDIADKFWELAVKREEDIVDINEAEQKFLDLINNIQTVVQDTNAVYTVGYNENSFLSLTLDPGVKELILESARLDDPNFFHFVTYHKDSPREINGLFRRFVLQNVLNIDLSKANLYKFLKGEWIMLTSPRTKALSGNQSNILYTGAKLKVLECSELTPYKAPGSDTTLFFYMDVTAQEYGPGGKVMKFSTLGLLQSNLRDFNEYVMGLRKRHIDPDYLLEKFSTIQLCFTLNVHKAQGQTYLIAYIPIGEFCTEHANGGAYFELAYHNGNNKKGSLIDTAAEIYTALTRSANVTIIAGNPTRKSATQAYSNYIGSVPTNILEINKLIVLNRKKATPKVIEDATIVAEQILLTEPVQSIDKDTYLTKIKNLGIPNLEIAKAFMDYVTGDPTYFEHIDLHKDYFNLLQKLFLLREQELLYYGHSFGKIVKDENGNYDFKAILHDPSILYTEFTLETAKAFPKIRNRVIQDNLIMLPKMNEETFMLGNHRLSEINESFFKNRNYYYRSHIKELDLIVRTTTGAFNIAFREDINPDNEKNKLLYGELFTPIMDGQDVLDKEGNVLFTMPKNAIMYNKNGEVTIVILAELATQAGNTKLFSELSEFLDSVEEIVSIQTLASNLIDPNAIRKLAKIAFFKSEVKFQELEILHAVNLGSVEDKKKKLFEIYNSRTNEKNYNHILASIVYQSFARALPVIAARIPTLAFASWMRMNIAAYLPNLLNNAFVSRWQLWLQGSDLDIDKVYIMGHAINKIGLYEHWSPLAKQVSNAELAKIAEDLPVPNNYKIILQDDPNEFEDLNSEIVLLTTYGQDQYLVNKIITYSQESNRTEKFRILTDIINWFDNNKTFDITLDILTDKTLYATLKHIVKEINRHNLYTVTEGAMKNLELLGMSRVITDPRNLISKQTTIDQAMSEIRLYLDTIIDTYPSSAYDLKSIYRLEEANQTGKKVVGVMANALKAFACISLYVNNKYAEDEGLDVNDSAYFLNSIKLNGKTYSFTTTANAKATLELFKILEDLAKTLTDEDLGNFLRTGIIKNASKQELLTNFKDISIILGAFTSMATDNAKELGLAKVHASINLASMHCYLAMMGVPVKDIVDFTANSAIFTKLYELTQANGWDASNGNVTSQTWRVLLSQAMTKQELETLHSESSIPIYQLGWTKEDVMQLKKLYNYAQEMKEFTRKLGINQGLKTGEADTIHFINDFRDTALNYYNRFIEARNSIIDTVLTVLQEVYDLTNGETASVYQIYNNLNEVRELPYGVSKVWNSLIYPAFARGDHKLFNILTLKYVPMVYIRLAIPYIRKLKNVFGTKQDFFYCMLYIHGILANDKLNLIYKTKINKSYNLIQDLVNNGIDFELFFESNTYQEDVIRALDVLKGTINSLDIIVNTPHFYLMFKGAEQLLANARKGCARELYLQKTIYDLHKHSDIKLDGLRVKESLTVDEIKSANNFFDDAIISLFITSEEAQIFLNFNYKLSNEGASKTVNLQNTEGYKDFKTFTHIIIARLKNKLSDDNKFLLHLLPINKSKESGKYDISYELIDYDANDLLSGNEEIANLAREIIRAFDSIADIKVSTLIQYENNINKNFELTVGDILWFYDLIFNQNKFGNRNLSEIFNGGYVINDTRSLNPLISKLKFYQDFDLKKRTLDIDPVLFEFFIHRKAIAKQQRENLMSSYLLGEDSKEVNNDVTINGEKIVEPSTPLWNLSKTIANNSFLQQFELFKKAYQDHKLDIKIICK